ncbi:MAG: YmdB family metallophosphoesterase [Clostridia bacterium]|nr:YmdB family metallophosphoesterase [Clostridia bacterium]
MRILFIGDIVGTKGVDFVVSHLNSIRKLNKIDFCIANGENSSPAGKGITKDAAQRLFMCGVDIITLGNHAFNHNDVYALMEDEKVIRPLNYPKTVDGQGFMELDDIAVINVSGRVYMDNLDCPFTRTEEILNKISAKTIIVDFHGEATSEKRAFAEYFDGKVSAVIGTHTHVQTADETIFKNGTAFITDAGMTGAKDSILGVRKDEVINMFLTGLPARFAVMDSPVLMNCVMVETNTEGRAISIERINLE